MQARDLRDVEFGLFAIVRDETVELVLNVGDLTVDDSGQAALDEGREFGDQLLVSGLEAGNTLEAAGSEIVIVGPHAAWKREPEPAEFAEHADAVRRG